MKGHAPQAPPVLAVRSFGKGRIACYPLGINYSGRNHRNPWWADVVECNGDPGSRQPSDSMKMQMNACRWAGEPALGIAGFGTFKPEPYKPVQFPKAVSWDRDQFSLPAKTGVRGIFGAHTSYSDGEGTVADYVKAAKAAGLSFIVFNDPLEGLTSERLARLKADCAAVSKDDDFYACPGIEFTDGVGNRWAFWGENVVFPQKTFQEGGKTYRQWDGQRVREVRRLYHHVSIWRQRPVGL